MMHLEISRKEERLGHLFQQASDLQKTMKLMMN